MKGDQSRETGFGWGSHGTPKEPGNKEKRTEGVCPPYEK